MAQPTKIEIRNIRLENLIADMESKGILRIPRFQRDYVWERAKVAELFDSLYREFPIGSFFLWITPREYRDLYKDIPELRLPNPADYEQIKMILDGQQRITSLYVAAKGLTIQANGKSEKDYKKICFDLDTRNFLVAKRTEDKTRVVSVWRFFSREGERAVYDDLTKERRDSFQRCQSTLLNYPLSIVEVREVHLGDAVKIFERINQGGKRLVLFDLVVASTWSTDFDLKEKVRALNKALQEKGFGKIDEEVVAQLISLVVKGQCTRAVQLQLKNEEIKAVWGKIDDAVKLAVDFLSSNLGVRIYDFVPYPSMIAMVAYLFVKADSRSLSPQQAAFVKQWFWKVAFSQHYSSSTLTLMGSDRTDYFDPAAEGRVVAPNYPVTLTPEDLESLMIHTRSAVKNAILCILALRGPRHFKNGSVVVLDGKICSEYNNPEKHHIFPKALLSRLRVEHRHLLANFAFIPGELNREISASRPSEYFSKFKTENTQFDKVLETHLIPHGPNSPIWKDEYGAFAKARIESIFHEIEKVVGTISPLEIELEQNPAAVLDRLEAELRTHIDGGLTEQFGDKYWDVIPQGTRELVEKRLSERLRRHPYEREDAATNYQRLTFCDIMDYAQIVLKNWQVFEGAFGSRGEVERHFLNLKEYRNALKHAREMNAVERKQGEASVEWLFRILERARQVAALSEGGLTGAEALESNGQDEGDDEKGDKNMAPPRRWNWDLLKQRLRELGEEEVTAAQQIIDWARNNNVDLDWRKNLRGGFILRYHPEGKNRFSPFGVTGAGKISWNAPHQGDDSPSPFNDREKRAEILKRLQAVKGATVDLDKVDRYGGLKLPVRVLANEDARREFFSVCAWIKETLEAKA
jgi:hypothetical protein